MRAALGGLPSLKESTHVGGVGLESSTVGGAEPPKRVELQGAAGKRPGRGGSSADERESPEHTTADDAVCILTEEELTRLPPEQDGVEWAEELRYGRWRDCGAALEVDEAALLMELGGDPREAGACITEGKPRPLGKVRGSRRAVSGQVTASEFGECTSTVDGP